MAKDTTPPTIEQLAERIEQLTTRVDKSAQGTADKIAALLSRVEKMERDTHLPSDEQMQNAIGGAMNVISGLVRLAKDQLASSPLSPTSTAWRALHDHCAELLNLDELAEAQPAPRGPLVMPPRARGGAVPAPPSRPQDARQLAPMHGGTGGAVLASPVPQTGAQRSPQTGLAGSIRPDDIRNRPDVAAELDRLKNPANPPTK
jgi:hypothetical protein